MFAEKGIGRFNFLWEIIKMSEGEKTENKKQSTEELWDEIREGYKELTKNLPTRMPYEPKLQYKERLHSLIPYLTIGLKYRTANLAETAIKLFEEEKLLPAIIITRSIFETVCLLFYLHKRLSEVVKDRKVGDFVKIFTRIAIGGKEEMAPIDLGGGNIEALNILTAIDKVDGKFKGIRKEYNFLSDFAHPNLNGVLISFSYVNNEESCIEFSNDVLCKQLDLSKPSLDLLSICLGIFIVYEKKIDELLPKFKEICDEGRE